MDVIYLDDDMSLGSTESKDQNSNHKSKLDSSTLRLSSDRLTESVTGSPRQSGRGRSRERGRGRGRGRGRARGRDKHQGPKYGLQHLIRKCKKITKCKSPAAIGSPPCKRRPSNSSSSRIHRSKFMSTFRSVSPLSRSESSASRHLSRSRRSRSRSSSLSLRTILRRRLTRSRSRSRSRLSRSRSRSRSRLSRSRSRSMRRLSRSRSRSRRRLSRSRSRSRSRRRLSRSISRSRSRRRLSRSISRSKRHLSRSRSRSRRKRSRSSSLSLRTISRRHLSRYRSRSRKRLSRSRSRRNRSRSRSRSRGRLSRSRSRSKRNLSRSESRSRRRLSRSSSRSRRRLSRSNSRSRRRLSRSRSKSRRSRSRSSSDSRSRIYRHRSRSLSQHTSSSRQVNSIIQNKPRSRRLESTSDSSSGSDSSSDSTSVSGRRPWLKHRTRSPREREESSVTGLAGRRRFRSSSNTVHHRSRSSSKSSRSSSMPVSFKPNKTNADQSFILSSASMPSKDVGHTKSHVDTELFPFVTPEDISYFKGLLSTPTGQVSTAEQDKRLLITLLLKVKNGSPEVAKESVKAVQNLARRMDSCLLLNTLLRYCVDNKAVKDSMLKVVIVIDAIIFRVGRKLRPFVLKILEVIQHFMMGSVIKEETLAVRIITKLTKIFGLKGMLPFLQKDLESINGHTWKFACRSLSVIASIVGMEAVLPVIKEMCSNKNSTVLTKSGFRVIKGSVRLMKERAHPYIKQLIQILQADIGKASSRTHTEWVEAVAALAKIAQREDIPAFTSFWDVLLPVYSKTSTNLTELASSVQKAVFSILHLKSAATVRELEEISRSFIRMCSSSDVELRKCSMQVMTKLSRCTYIPDNMYDDVFLCPFIRYFLVATVAYDDTAREQFTQVCLRSCKRVTANKVCFYIMRDLAGLDEVVAKMVAAILVTVIQKYGVKQLTYKVEKEILVQFCQAVNKQTSQNTEILKSFLSVITVLGRRLCVHTKDIQQNLHDRTLCSPQQAKLQQEIRSRLFIAGGGRDRSSGLVMDGCVWNIDQSREPCFS